MANKEQLAILKQGVAAWNKWREENPDAKINLRGAKLDRLNLSGANFQKADIRGANFSKALLIKTIFSESKAGYSTIGLFYHKILIIALVLTLLFSMVGIYILAAVSLQYIIIIYNNTSLAVFILSLSMPSLMIIFFVIFTFIKSKYRVVTFIIYIISIILVLPLTSLLFSYIIFIIFSVSDGLIKVSNFMIPEKILKLQNGKHILSMGNANITIGYIAIFILIISYIIWGIWHEAPRFISLRKMLLSAATTLFTTNFQQSNLTSATFYKSNISYTRFNNAVLTKTSFKDSNGLHISCCDKTILDDRNVRKLLVRGNGQGLSLKGKNLQGAHLVNADLLDTDLRGNNFVQANLSGANITGAKLYGSARENWIIDGIRCKYVYWDEAGEQRTPPDRDFRPGEFEELLKQLPTFEYIFEQDFTPLDPLIMQRVVQAVNERHKEFSLELVNFDKRGEPHATFTVCRLDYLDAARKQIEEGYERNRIAPERQEQLMDIISKLIDHNTMLAGNQSKSLDIINKQLGEAMGDTYNIHGGQIGAVGQSASASGNTFQQITADLSRLHEEMQRSAKTPEQRAAAEDVAKAAQSAREQNEPKMRQHLKNAGRFVVDFAKSIGTEALSEYLKKITLGI